MLVKIAMIQVQIRLSIRFKISIRQGSVYETPRSALRRYPGTSIDYFSHDTRKVSLAPINGDQRLSVAFTKEESAETASETLLPDRPISPHPNLVTETGLKISGTPT